MINMLANYYLKTINLLYLLHVKHISDIHISNISHAFNKLSKEAVLNFKINYK